MHAALSTASAPVPGGPAAVHAVGVRAGRRSLPAALDFVGQLAQALGVADATVSAESVSAKSIPEHSAATPQDGQRLSQPVPPAQPTAPVDPAVTPSAQPESAQAPARAPDRANSARPDSQPHGRRAESARPGNTVALAQSSSEHDPSPTPVVTGPPAPALAASVPAAAGQGSPAEENATADGPVQGASANLERPPARHDPATAAMAAPQDAAPPASPHETLSEHQVTAARPALDAPEVVLPSRPADPPAMPSSVQLGAPTPLTHAAPPSPATVPSSPAQASLPGPATQITPALVHIVAAPDGSQRVTVRLDPVELGELHIRIERPHEGPVQVTVEATRPETLQLLRQDEPALHRALDQAGLSPEGRIVVLQQPSAENGGQRQGAAETDSGTSASGGGSQGGSRGNSQGWSQHGNSNESAPDGQSRHAGNWLRTGVNITA